MPCGHSGYPATGATLIWFAPTVPIVLRMTDIGVDAAVWYMDRRIMQTVSGIGARVAGAMQRQI